MPGKMGKRFQQARDAVLDRAYLITLGAAIAVIAASAMYTDHIRQETGVQAAADAPEIAQSPAATPRPALTPLPTIAPLNLKPVQLRLDGGAVRPVSGDVIRGDSGSRPVWWEALSCVQVHRGADIAGQPQEDVLCLMDGVVERVTRDPLWGWRVQIQHAEGSTAVYAGLGLCWVKEGQTLSRGQVIGELLEYVPCEAEWGAHLHLEIERNGENVDPETLLADAVRR